MLFHRQSIHCQSADSQAPVGPASRRRTEPGQASRAAPALVGLLGALCLLGLNSSMASAGPISRPAYHGQCEIPRAGWNEEVLRAREAAARECKENTLRLASDRGAALTTEAEDRFWEMKSRHDALLRRSRETATAH